MLIAEASHYLVYQTKQETPDTLGRTPWRLMQVALTAFDKPVGIYTPEALPPIVGLARQVDAEFETRYLLPAARRETVELFDRMHQSLGRSEDELTNILGLGAYIVYSYV